MIGSRLFERQAQGVVVDRLDSHRGGVRQLTRIERPGVIERAQVAGTDGSELRRKHAAKRKDKITRSERVAVGPATVGPQIKRSG